MKSLTLALIAPCLALSGCAVVSVASTVVSTAVSVGATVVTTGVKVTGKVVEKTVDVVAGGEEQAAK